MTSRAKPALRFGLLLVALSVVIIGLWFFADLGPGDTRVVAPAVRVTAAPPDTTLPDAGPERSAARLDVEPDAAPAPAAAAVGLRASSRVTGLETLPQAEFRGRVLDERGQSIPGATVHFVPGHTAYHTLGADIWWAHDVDAADLPRTTTAEDGTFSMKGPSVARCEDGATIGGYWPSSPALVITSPGRTSHPHVCDPMRGDSYDAGDLRLEPEALLRGRLVDERNEPVAGATLTLVNHALDPARIPPGLVLAEGPLLEIFARATSDEHGDFRIVGLWQGAGKLEVAGESVVPKTLEDLALHSGVTTDLGLVRVDRGAVISGRVLDADGHPVAGAELLVTDEDLLGSGSDVTVADAAAQAWQDPYLRRRAVSDPDAGFKFGDLDPEAVHFVAARAAGQHPVALHGVPTGGPPLELRFERLGLLDVKLVDAATGEPVEAGRVLAWMRHLGTLVPTAVHVDPLPMEQSSVFRVHGAGREGTWIEVEAPGYAKHWSGAEGVPEGALASVEIRLAPEYRIIGRVLDEHGVGIADATVEARLSRSDDGGVLYPGKVQCLADEHGSYELPRLVSGLWDLSVRAQGWLELNEEDVRASREPQLHDLRLQRAACIEGVLSGTDGLPLPSQELVLLSLDPEGGAHHFQFGRSRLLGRYRFDGLPAGNYLLRWNGARRISLAVGENLRLDLQERRAPVLSLRLLGDLAEAAPRIRILSVRDEMGLPWRSFRIETPVESAQFELQLPAAGRYAYSVAASGLDGMSGVSQFEAGWGAVVVRDVSLGSRTLNGSVVSLQDGAPLAAAQVLLSAENFETIRIETETDVEGAFRFARLQPGRYKLSASAPHHRQVDPLTVHIVPDAAAESVVITLPRAALLRLALHGDAQADQQDSAWFVVFDADREQSVHADYVRLPAQREVAELLPGRYWLILLDNNFSGPVDWPSLAGSMTPVDLADGQVTEATLRVIRLTD